MNVIHQNFLRKISSEISQNDQIPLFGNAPPLDLENFSQNFKTSLGLEELSIRVVSQNKRAINEILTGENQSVTAFTLSPLESPLFWIMEETDKTKLTGHILSNNSRKKSFQSKPLQEGFYQFILLQALNAAQDLDPIQKMTLHLSHKTLPLDLTGIVCHIEIEIFGTSCYGMLIIPEDFRKNWVQHFSAFPKQYYPKTIAKNLILDLHVVCGSVSLTSKELKEVQAGDVIIPDQISKKQNVLIYLNSNALFSGKIDQNTLYIEDFAFTQEDPMDEDFQHNLSEKLDMSDTQSEALHNIAFNVQIELAKVKMSLDELMQLTPGDTISLPDFSEQKVSLIVNGKKIGSAELIVIGETLGLKILEI